MDVFKRILKFAPLPDPILILGESGTGKELVATAIHAESKRSGAFVALNCGAIPKELFESELFGHVKGSFTGALKTKKGAFDRAHHGTLFLDEIAELPLEQQVKLLRVLETGQIQPVGSEKHEAISTRIVCATHQDLKKRVEQATFREDLFYRIHVLPIDVPSLRERCEDIELLAKHFAKLRGASIDEQALQALMSFSWPGNIRELKNTIFRLSALSATSHISLELLKKATQNNSQNNLWTSLEKTHIQNLLTQLDGNKAKVALHMGIARGTLYRKLQKYNLV